MHIQSRSKQCQNIKYTSLCLCCFLKYYVVIVTLQCVIRHNLHISSVNVVFDIYFVISLMQPVAKLHI